MSDPGSLVPISDEQAKAIQEAIKALRGVGGFLKEILGTVPQDLVGYFGGDLLKVRRAENAACIVQEAKDRLEARKAASEQPSISVALPLLIAAANESRDELQEIWARLLAAAADAERAKSFRIQFIEVAKQLDPLDAAVLNAAEQRAGAVDGQIAKETAEQLKVRRDEIAVSLDNLSRLSLMVNAAVGSPRYLITPFGREFLLAISD